MGVYRRAVLYIRRKRGQTTVLFFLFCIVSTFLVTGWSVLDSADAVAKVLRRSVGGAFYLRPTSNLEINEGSLNTLKEEKVSLLLRRKISKTFWVMRRSRLTTQ